MPVCNSLLEKQEYKTNVPANIFFNGHLVTFEEWKNNQKINKSDRLYPAYVPSIEPKEYGLLLKNFGYILGSNENPSNDTCGMIYRKIQCSQNHLHEPSYKHERCNDPGCPVCYVKFASRMADRITERIQGFKTVWRNEKPYHLIFWGEKWTRDKSPYGDLRAAHKKAKTL